MLHYQETWLQTYQEAWAKYMSDDTEFVRNQVQKDGLYLKNASNRLKNDPETVKLAVQQNGLALQFASDFVKQRREIVRLAVKQNGLALQYALHHRNDLEIVISAIQQNKRAIIWAGALMELHPAIKYTLNPNAKSSFDSSDVEPKKKTVKEKKLSSRVKQKKQSHSSANKKNKVRSHKH
jgi:D-lyxose ketol-isomerase